MDCLGQACRRRIRRRLVTLLPWIFVGVQVLSGQPIEWSISSPTPKVGEPFTLSLRLDQATLGQTFKDEGMQPELIPPKEDFFPSSLQLFKGPIVQTRRERVEGRFSQYLLVSYVFVAQEAGRFTLNSARFQWGGKEFSVRPFLLSVAQKDPPYLVPFELAWEHPPGPFYIGQAIPLKLVVRDQKKWKAADSIQVVPTPGGILEKVTNLSGEEPEKEREGWVQSTIAQYVYTPYREGTRELPVATVKIEGLEQRIEGKKLIVQPIPEGVRSTSGAVGSFSIRASLEEPSIPGGSTTTLRIRIEGKGNLHWAKVPSIQAGDCSLIYEGRKSQYLPTWQGYEGWVEEAYRVFPQRAGVFTIRIETFHSWNPFQHRIQELVLPPLTLRVLEPPQRVSGGKVSSGQLDLELLPPDTRVSGWTNWIDSPRTYFLLLPVILGIVGIFVWRGGTYVPYLAGWILCLGGFILPFEALRPQDPKGPQAVAEYNRGVRYGKEGQWGEAVFHLRKAVYLSPDPRFRASLRRVEEVYVPTFRAPLPRWVPDYWFLLGIGTLHLLAVGYLGSKREGRWKWFLSVGCSALLLIGYGMYSSFSEMGKPWGVITVTNSVLRKIPSEAAQEGIPLPPGSSFFVGTEKGEYVYVFLEGVKGWVKKKNLRRE